MSASCARLPTPPGEPHVLSSPCPRPPRRPSFAMGLVLLEAAPPGSLSLGLDPRELSSSLRPSLSVLSWKEARRAVGPPEAARRPAVQGAPHVLLPFPESCSTRAAETHAPLPQPEAQAGAGPQRRPAVLDGSLCPRGPATSRLGPRTAGAVQSRRTSRPFVLGTGRGPRVVTGWGSALWFLGPGEGNQADDVF